MCSFSLSLCVCVSFLSSFVRGKDQSRHLKHLICIAICPNSSHATSDSYIIIPSLFLHTHSPTFVSHVCIHHFLEKWAQFSCVVSEEICNNDFIAPFFNAFWCLSAVGLFRTEPKWLHYTYYLQQCSALTLAQTVTFWADTEQIAVECLGHHLTDLPKVQHLSWGSPIISNKRGRKIVRAPCFTLLITPSRSISE